MVSDRTLKSFDRPKNLRLQLTRSRFYEAAQAKLAYRQQPDNPNFTIGGKSSLRDYAAS